jgi:nitronate monooxygenase
VDALLRHGIEMVITSVGSPEPIMSRLKEAGIFVFADVATVEHARKSIDVGVDGLILLTAGAGGQTGWLNPFAYARAVREIFDGPIVLAGGISDGVALRAAEVLGCDLAYMGTKFIVARESMAADEYREMLVRSSMDDIVLTKAFNGLWGSYLRPSIVAAGLDPDRLDESISAADAKLCGPFRVRRAGRRDGRGNRRSNVAGISGRLGVHRMTDKDLAQLKRKVRESSKGGWR